MISTTYSDCLPPCLALTYLHYRLLSHCRNTVLRMLSKGASMLLYAIHSATK